MDWTFLERQCFGDRLLERELLLLFIASAAGLVGGLAAMAPREQEATAHRLKGSSQGIGAWPMARAAQAVEDAAPPRREAALAGLASAHAEAERAIRARLATS